MKQGLRFIEIYSAVLLTLSICLLLDCNKVDALVGSNTVESIVKGTAFPNEPAQFEVDGSPNYIYGDLSTSDILYVANSNGMGIGTLTAIDTTTYHAKDIPVGIHPSYIYGELSHSKLYVLNSGDENNNINGTVSVVDTSNNTVIQNIPVGSTPTHIYGDLSYSNLIYVLNSGGLFRNGTVSVVDTSNNTVIQNIPVGSTPTHIYGDLSYSNLIYVANTNSPFSNGTISVIDTAKNNTVIQNIPVGVDPQYIFGSLNDPDLIYVANSGDPFNNKTGTISVIDTAKNNTVIQNIPVGMRPSYIFGSFPEDLIYVSNSGRSIGNGTISVIDTAKNNTVIQDIPVEMNPGNIVGVRANESIIIYVANLMVNSSTISAIDMIDTKSYNVTYIDVGKNPVYIDSQFDAVYVANQFSNSISVIDGVKKEVVAGVTFDILPFGSGDIVCDTNLETFDAPQNLFFYVPSGTKCIAKPIAGFEFLSWVEYLEGNSTRTINASTPSDSPLAHFVICLGTIQAASLTLNRFGNFTANFKALPPPVPAGYWASLFTIVATALIGSLLIPALLGWFKSRRQTSRLSYYHQGIASLYEDDKSVDKDIARLNKLNKSISDEHSQGRITKEQYENLKKDVSVRYYGIFSERLDPSMELRGADVSHENLDGIKKEITDAYSKDKITELHYKLLNEKISKMTKANDNGSPTH